jgi:hydrogenase maturation protease
VSNLNGAVSSGASDGSATAPPRLVVIGCGNPARSDDGAGVAVVQQLMRQPPVPGVQLIDAGTAGMDVMFRVRGAEHVVIVDACRSGSEAGAIFRMSGREAMTPTQHRFSLHGLRWDHALYAGCQMFGEDFVDHTEVILIEAGALDFGLELSTPVQSAAQRVAQMLAPLVAENA